MFRRSPFNPLVSPKDVRPSRPDLEVVGCFNPGAAVYGGHSVLLVRVAERPIQTDPRYQLISIWNPTTQNLETRAVARSGTGVESSDARVIQTIQGSYLTSLSHLRVAWVDEQGRATIESQPALFPQESYERFGIEDPRITEIDGRYYITYAAISEQGIVTALASTLDFSTFTRHGILFPPDNKDVVLFPGRAGGRYYALHRPSASHYGSPEMWIADSPDLVHWGGHQRFLPIRPGHWDGVRVGAGAPPLYTPVGWLEIYHGADHQLRYCLGAVLTAADAPGRILARTQSPIFMPDAPYERSGFFPDVVFAGGAIYRDNIVTVYYGAADSSVASAQTSLDAILEALDPKAALSEP